MNYRLMKKLILFVGVCVGILSAQIANAESPIWGIYKVECPANSDTYIGITTTRAPVFTGKVQSVQSGTTNIVAQGEPNWSANQFVYVAGSQTNHYYLKFTSGELALINPSPFAFNSAFPTSHFLEWADSTSETIIALLPWNCRWERNCGIIPRPTQRPLAFLRPSRSLRFPTQSAWPSDDLWERNRSRFP